ncbi:MAG: sensor histidine kinase [Gammaproteobacteria bacterium]|nr:MAG: sensor histidine kinase [Gammaproteobacteria bacterium]
MRPSDLFQPLAGMHQSLLARLALVVVALTFATTGALFIGIDFFITRQFDDLRQERLLRLAERVQTAVAEERRRLDGITQLLVNDTELRNSTYYHLFLAGERAHPRAAIERAAEAFDLDRIELWRTDGRPIVDHGADVAFAAPRRAGDGLTRASGAVWLTAQRPLTRDHVDIAWLRLARPLQEMLDQRFGDAGEFEVRLAGNGPPHAGDLRVALDRREDVFVDVRVPDTAGAALNEVKRLVGQVLALSGLLMMLIFVSFLRWQLRPLLALHRAAERVGRGDFSTRLAATGSREIAGLIDAFNRMAEGLKRSHEMEERLRHQEQLSAIGRVAARVAHSINNPLSVIHNLARLMQRQPANDTQREDIESILHHSNRAIHTVELLLQYGRPVKPRLEDCDLREVVADICRRWASRNAAAIDLRAETAAPALLDRLQFEELLENLLDNAAEAAPGEPIEVHLEVEEGQAELRVRDRGPGFSPEAREHLFEPFHTTKADGNGLGLASALAIARAHGGDMALGEGPGAEIIVRMPLSRMEGTASGRAAP